MNVVHVVLAGEFVRLRPMSLADTDELFVAGADESLWQWTTNIVKNKNDMRRYVEGAIADYEHGFALPFVITDKRSREVIGSTRFGNIDAANRRVEIGWTWIIPSHQRSVINTEAKFLMFQHAFEVWKCIRVELKTDALNTRSRAAIKRIGAVEEGILRNHLITESGRFRDSVYFSIIENEWPAVKQNILLMLGSY